MAKTRTTYVCDNCGAEYPKWVGKCSACGAWESIREFREAKVKGVAAAAPPSVRTLSQKNAAPLKRLATGERDFDQVTGGGLVPGSILLFGGEPGIGKSTLLLQLAGRLAAEHVDCLYFSGEESVEQLGMRAKRLGIHSERLAIANASAVEGIVTEIQERNPAVVVIDSIQTTYTEEGESLPGSLSQVRSSANRFLRLAKDRDVVIILVGHITKDGYLAGPKMLEHLVDTVLYLEGDRQHQVRLLRAVKNRFGATSELGVYEMTPIGLQPVANPSELYLDPQRAAVSGSVIVSDLEGNRTFFLEVQALVSNAAYGNPQRNVTGFDLRRLQMLLAVLERRVGFRMGTQDVFTNVVGGFKLDEPAADLGVAVAVVSSLKDRPVDPRTLVLGEVGLGGEVRGVQQIRRRLEEAAKLGFKQAVVPESDRKHLDGLDMRITPVRSVLEAVDTLF